MNLRLKLRQFWEATHSCKRGTHKILDLLHRKTCSICDNWTDNWAVITTNLAEEENTHSATSLCASTVSTLTVHSFTRLPLDAEPESVNRFNYRKANVKFEEVCAKSQARFAWILSLVCACVCDYFWHWLCHCWCAALCGCSSILFREMWNDAKRWPSVGRLCSLCLCVCLGLFIWVMHRSSLKGKHAACAVCHLPLAASRMPHATCWKAAPDNLHAVSAKQITRSNARQRFKCGLIIIETHSHTHTHPHTRTHTHVYAHTPTACCA